MKKMKRKTENSISVKGLVLLIAGLVVMLVVAAALNAAFPAAGELKAGAGGGTGVVKTGGDGGTGVFGFGSFMKTLPSCIQCTEERRENFEERRDFGMKLAEFRRSVVSAVLEGLSDNEESQIASWPILANETKIALYNRVTGLAAPAVQELVDSGFFDGLADYNKCAATAIAENMAAGPLHLWKPDGYLKAQGYFVFPQKMTYTKGVPDGITIGSADRPYCYSPAGVLYILIKRLVFANAGIKAEWMMMCSEELLDAPEPLFSLSAVCGSAPKPSISAACQQCGEDIRAARGEK